jgi:hypothetical protein
MASSSCFRLFAATAVVGVAGVVGSALLGGSVTSCLTTQSYVYFAQRYDPTGDCVEAYEAIEVVNGSGASSTCPAACLTVGADLYVSTVCPPLPAIATEVEADAGDCILALAAAKSGGTCDAPADGGDGDEGGADAEVEAGDEDGGADAEVDAADGSMGLKDAGDAG